jgi:hypothetical protein
MAVTTGYYERLPNTVQTRMNFVVDMNLPVEGDNALIRNEDVVAFTTRYLNAVRLGGAKLKEWYEKETIVGETSVPNHCDTCNHRQVCHGSFGQTNDIGLYPFTGRAILNMARHKDVVRGGFNPRRLIKDVLAEVLDGHRAELANGEFPSEILRLKMVGRGRGLAPVNVDRLRRADPNHYSRQRAVLELWGSLNELTKLPDSLYEAFDLPVPQIKDQVDRGEDKDEPSHPPPSPGIDPKIEAVRNWANGNTLLERVAGDLRELVYDAIVSHINWDAVGLERAYFTHRRNGPFRERNIIFRNQQTQASPGAVRLTIPLTENTDDLRRAALALEGLLQFRHHHNWDFAGGELHFVALGECLEEWSATLLNQFRRLPDGQHSGWDPVAMGVELLAVGAALAGRPTGPEPSPAEYVNALFEEWPDEAPVQSSEWKKLYRTIHRKCDTLRQVVRARTSGTKGGTIGGFVDATTIVSLLQRLQQTWIPNAIAPKETDRLRKPYDSMTTLHSEVQNQLPLVVQKEYDHKIAWLKKVQQHISPETEQRTVIQALHQIRESAAAAGLVMDSKVLTQFDTACLEFEEIELSRTLIEVTNLGQLETQARILSSLVGDSTLRTIISSADFFQVATRLLTVIERAIQRETQRLEKHSQGGVSTVQQRIHNNLEELDRLLTVLGGEECS